MYVTATFKRPCTPKDYSIETQKHKLSFRQILASDV